MDVPDLADAAFCLLKDAPPRPGTVDLYNISTGKETAVLDLAQKLCNLAGGFTAFPAGESASRSGISRSCGYAGRLRSAIGWRPRIGWEESLAEFWAEVCRKPLAA